MATSTSAATIISTTEELKTFISSIPSSSTLYLDLQGHNLSRHGTISLITILIHPQAVVRLIDVITLGKSAFTTTTNTTTTTTTTTALPGQQQKEGKKSLQSILQDPNLPKYLWDVRNGADALWALYQVRLAGVVDLQLLENASRAGDKTYLSGLDKAVKFDLTLGPMELNHWIRSRRETRGLPSMPPTVDVFSVRPIRAKTVQYCTDDVSYLPDLHSLYLGRMGSGGEWLTKVQLESSRRVQEVQSPTYELKSSTRAIGPWGQGPGKGVLSIDEFIEKLEDKRIDGLESDKYGDHKNDLYYDDGPTSCKDIIFDYDHEYYYSD